MRLQFQKAYVHLIRMSESSFLKHSGVFEMFGVDFLLDNELNLWFIECNASPQLIGTNEEKTELLTSMLEGMFEIQYAYLRSRMKRVRGFIAKMHRSKLSGQEIDYRGLQTEFQEVNKNRLEPEFEFRDALGWIKIMDKNLKGKDAYMGLIDAECVDDEY